MKELRKVLFPGARVFISLLILLTSEARSNKGHKVADSAHVPSAQGWKGGEVGREALPPLLWCSRTEQQQKHVTDSAERLR